MKASYFRKYLLFLITAFAIFAAYNTWQIEKRPPPIDYTALLEKIEKNEIKRVHMRGRQLTVTDQFGQTFLTYVPEVSNILPRLESREIIISASKELTPSPFWSSTFPVLLIFGGWMYFTYRQSRGKSDSFAKKKALQSRGKPTVTFNDVAGIPEAKESLEEIIDFLRDTKKYTKLGGRLPRGVLLQGPT